MSQVGRLATVKGRGLISASRILEAIKSVAIEAVDISSVKITEEDRINALQRIINLRKLRGDAFPSISFSDPFWDIILNLSYDSMVSRETSIKSICVGSGLPITTGLRYLSILVDSRVVYRTDDPKDGRRSFVSLTNDSMNLVNTLLDAWIRDIALMKLSELDFELVDSFQM